MPAKGLTIILPSFLNILQSIKPLSPKGWWRGRYLFRRKDNGGQGVLAVSPAFR